MGIPLLFDSTHKVEIGPDNKPGRGSCIAPPVDSAIDEVAVYDYAFTANQTWVSPLGGDAPFSGRRSKL